MGYCIRLCSIHYLSTRQLWIGEEMTIEEQNRVALRLRELSDFIGKLGPEELRVVREFIIPKRFNEIAEENRVAIELARLKVLSEEQRKRKMEEERKQRWLIEQTRS